MVRVTDEEHEGFSLAAEILGLPLSTWARMRLREDAIRDLERVGRKAPFVAEVRIVDEG